EAAQAVNTLMFDGEVILGDNTDGAGLVSDIKHHLHFNIKNQNILLMGTGGAAWGVTTPLLEQSCRITIGYRSPEKAQLLVDAHSTTHRIPLASMMPVLDSTSYASLAKELARDILAFDLVINATSSSLSDEMPSLPIGIFSPNALAYDMMYGRETPFMKFAREHGAQVADGLGMLVEQAAEAFYLWRGVRPDTAPVIAALRNS
ncbi:MAG: shikimate dehydrogenase, partial [Gallionella sp.]